MTDITERLRARPTFTPHDQELLADAADAIKSRDATIAELRSAFETATRQLGEWAEAMRKTVDERDELRAELASLRSANDDWADATRAAIKDREELRAQVEALQADAERLDWAQTHALRIADECQNTGTWLVETLTSSATGDTLRDAIDAARSQEDGHG